MKLFRVNLELKRKGRDSISFRKSTTVLLVKFVISERGGRGGGSKKVLCCAQYLYTRIFTHIHKSVSSA